ncbi:cytochrome P450 4V2-like [Contarinia nasturtii]|uniref:cytochrome P450 4V2-like n=1 Tax=Contarinia nasturtii TaxID=265458 RepID=UPI0012D4231A|nr:cytochrome P450 4V2-like [Contarinia nasturtii]
MFGGVFSALSLAILILVLVVECWKVYLNKTKLKNFYHVKGWPVIGTAFNLIGKNNEQIFESFKTNELSYTWVGPMRLFHVDRPEDFQAILTSNKCLKKAFPYDFLNNRTGLLTAHPSIWKDHRRTLNVTLGSKMVHSFMPIFNEKFNKMCNLLERKLNSNIDIHCAFFNVSMDLVLSTSFGLNWSKLSMQNGRGDEIHNLIIEIMEDVQNRIQKCWQWNPIYKFTQNYETDVEKFRKFYQFSRSTLEIKRMDLAEKLEHGENELDEAKEKNCQNFLQKCLQLEFEQKWTMEEVYEEMDTMLIASVDTSATVLSGTIIMLAIHQEYQERVVDEMREIFESVDEPVTNDHLKRMSFSELVIKEALRYFPIAPFIGRECTADFPINGGIIPKGSQVFLDVLRMNKNPKYYGENVNEFYPERFLPENCANWHPYLSVPFSAGPRNCIGNRYAWTMMKIALSHILRRFKLTTDLRMQDVVIKPYLLLKIGNKNAIRIERREWKRESQII